MAGRGRSASDATNAFEGNRHLVSAFAALERRDFNTAVNHLRVAERAIPKDVRVHVTLGVTYQLLHRPSEAERAFAEALKIAPNEVPALFGMGATKADAGQFEEAEELLRRAVEISPNHLDGRIVLARTLRDLGRFDEAGEMIRETVALHPDKARAHSALAIHVQEAGEFEKASDIFRRALELDPTHAFSYHGLLVGRKVTEDDRPVLATIEKLVEEGVMTDDDRIDLLMGLGKAYNDLKEYDKAWENYSASNRIANANIQSRARFSKAEFERYADATRAIFTPAYLQEVKAKAEAQTKEVGPRPIFVVGMMRSGTTLVEQIISSHPQVAAGGEIAFWPREVFKCFDLERFSFDLYPSLGSRKKYNKLLRNLAPEAAFVTDKLPDNYRVIGALHMLYPNAKFIHCTRHPLDTCISILTTAFRKPAEYSRDPEFLTFVHKSYLRLMNYWRQILPPGTMLDVSYEELVNDRERVTRQMIDFCGLPWDDACLNYQVNSRMVLTASVWQARQPIYTSSIGRWKNYKSWLGPLEELLDL